MKVIEEGMNRIAEVMKTME